MINLEDLVPFRFSVLFVLEEAGSRHTKRSVLEYINLLFSIKPGSHS